MYCIKCTKDVLWAFGTRVVALKKNKTYKNISQKDHAELIKHGYGEDYLEPVAFLENKAMKIEYPTTLPHTKVYDPLDDEDGEEIDLLEVEKEMELENFDGSESIARKRGRQKKD